MRLRNNPKANDILAAHDDIVILDGKQYRGKWNEDRDPGCFCRVSYAGCA